MPFRNFQTRKQYQQNYYEKRTKPKRGSARPDEGIEDRKLLVSMRLKASLVGRLHRIFHEAIANRTRTWRNYTDMYDELVRAGLEKLRSDPEIDESLQYLDAVKATDAIGEQRREMQAAFNRAVTELKECLRIGAVDDAVHAYQAVMQAFERMSPSVWRDWFLRELPKKFPKLQATRLKGIALEAPLLPFKDRKPRTHERRRRPERRH